MKKFLALLFLLSSFSVFADTYRWKCSTHNFLKDNVENANAINVIYELGYLGDKKEFILSENSSVKMTLSEQGDSIKLEAVDKVTGKRLGTAIAGIDSRNLNLWPAEASIEGFYHISCFNLDYNRTDIDKSDRNIFKEVYSSPIETVPSYSSVAIEQ